MSEPSPYEANEGAVLVAPSKVSEAQDVRFFAPTPGSARVLVDLSRVEWMAPIGIVGLLALIHRGRADGIGELTVLLPTLAETRHYLGHAGFCEMLESKGIAVPDGIRAGPEEQPIRPCLTVRHVTTEFELEQVANELDGILESVGGRGQAREAVYTVMTELTNNAWQHGRGCYVMAQTHTGQHGGIPRIELAIADMGPGFATTLSAYGPTSEVAAIELAFDEGVTGTGDPRRGFGLWWVREAIDSYPGPARLSIVSFDGLVERRGRNFVTKTGPDCRGVFAAGYFPL